MERVDEARASAHAASRAAATEPAKHRGPRSLMVVALLAACSGNGGSGDSGANTGGGGNGGSSREADLLRADVLVVVAHDPADDEVQVALDATVRVEFGTVVAPECLAEPDTFLRPVGARTTVGGAFAVASDGKTVVFTPDNELRPETDYEFQLSALTCDIDGRLLEDVVTFSFRTFDETPPTVRSASVANGATGVARTEPLTIRFDERIDRASATPATVYLRDAFGTEFAADRTVDGDTLILQPRVDLPGDRQIFVVANGVEDRAGNRQSSSWSINFRTAQDTTNPNLATTWPGAVGSFSPRIQPTLTFDESMDPLSVESTGIRFLDEFGNIVTYDVATSPDQHTLRLVPRSALVSGRTYSISVTSGPGAITDLSGNALAADVSFQFGVGTDAASPTVRRTTPSSGSRGFARNGHLRVSFSEALDLDRLDASRVRLLDADGLDVETEITLDEDRHVVVAPDAVLATGANYELRVTGGQDGVRDLAGNPLAEDLTVPFTVSTDATLPVVFTLPADGILDVPRTAELRVLSAEPLAPDTVDDSTIVVTDDRGDVIAGTLELARANRVVRFAPTAAWIPGNRYTLTVRGGERGVRERSGNWLTDDLVSTFRIDYDSDTTAPIVNLTVDEISDERNDGLTLPPWGFTVDVAARDPQNFSLDMTSAEVLLSGADSVPSANDVFATAVVDGGELQWRCPDDLRLAPGSYTVRARVKDLSGNVGTSPALSFEVKEADAATLPFERTQVVWVRFDLDRDGNGTTDFEDDMLRLGLSAAGDPIGANRRMAALVRDGILARANELFDRKSNGGRAGPDSVAVRFSRRQPLGVPSMQIACGGLDPEGESSRGFGALSTGTLGRAFFDYKNGQVNDQNIGSNPGLGVFPGELFLFEAATHQLVYPGFVTTFASRFLALVPDMGGTPAGEHALDALVLAPTFDPESAPADQLARFNTILAAADDWATAIGTILAHEVGHSVGLVASGLPPQGLHGDESLHNRFSGIAEVMSAAVGYDALVSLDFTFRDVNLAYLRHRLLLK